MTAPDACRPSASAAWEISTAWSAGDSACRARSLSMTTSLPSARTMPPVCRQALDVLLEQPQVAAVAGLRQGLVELVGGGPDEREHQRVGVPAPAGQVEHADGLARHRVADRDPGAGQPLEPLGVVLVPEHVRGAARLERGPDPVGADDVLGVGEAGGELDGVELPFQVVVAGEPQQHQPARVGQHDADRLALELLVQVPQDRLGRPREGRVQVGLAEVAQVKPVGGDVPLPRPPPRGQDRLPDRLRVDRVAGEEPVPGLGQRVSHDGGGRTAARSRTVQPR